MKREASGMPSGVERSRWVDDSEAGTELYVVDDDLYLSYRAPGRTFADPHQQRQFELMNFMIGIDSKREETALVFVRQDRTWVLVGDHRDALTRLSPEGMVLYYRGSSAKCPFLPKDEDS